MTPIEFDLEALALGDEKSAGDTRPLLKTAFGKENRISLSPPRLEHFDQVAFTLSPAEVERHRANGHRLVVVSTTLSFIPDFGCAFVAADFSIGFSCSDAGGSPMVVDLHPREVTRDEDYQSQRERSAKLSGSLSPTLAEILAEAGGSSTVEIGGKRKIRDIWGFGLGGSEAGWRFQASLGYALTGIYDNLSFAMRLREGATLHAQIRFGAEIAIQDKLDQWVTHIFGLGRKRCDPSAVFAIEAA
jgi:hypothetical protein